MRISISYDRLFQISLEGGGGGGGGWKYTLQNVMQTASSYVAFLMLNVFFKNLVSAFQIWSFIGIFVHAMNTRSVE